MVVAAVLFSLTIETLQLFRMRELFEWDDLVNNTAGAVIGVILYTLLEKLLKGRYLTMAILSLGAVFSVICLCVLSS